MIAGITPARAKAILESLESPKAEDSRKIQARWQLSVDDFKVQLQQIVDAETQDRKPAAD